MFTLDFEAKLKKINPLMRIDMKNVQENRYEGSKLTGVFLGDLHMCSCPVPWVPVDTVRLPSGAIDAQGQRTILSYCVSLGCFSKAEAENEFRLDLGPIQPDPECVRNVQRYIEEYKKERPHEFAHEGYIIR